jgi:hypothetical protein
MPITWSRMEFKGAAENKLHPLGMSPSTWGSSGMFSRYLSTFSLKSSTETLVILLTYHGIITYWSDFINIAKLDKYFKILNYV